MAYNNYVPPPGAYAARQPPYGQPGATAPSPFPPMGAPPGFGAPPAFAPPGMHAQSPAGIQGQFQPPPNMPNINFNAPVIRLGLDQKAPTPQDRLAGGGGGRDRGTEGRGANNEPLGSRNRLGLGADARDGRNIERDRAQVRENMLLLQPPTREEVARTIFVGGLGEGAPDDEAIETLLRCAGKLRRWTRARDADDKKCKFGFAEYEDVDSLEAANEIYKDVAVPLMTGGAIMKNEDGEVKTRRLLVVVDEQSQNYIEEWTKRRKEDDDAKQFRIDGCKEDLRQCLAGLMNAGSFAANAVNGHAGADGTDTNGDTTMTEANGETKQGENAEVINIPLNLEDELSDIPPEQRATVAEEIKAFRDRSNRRDIERLRREEDLENQERQRQALASRLNRLASPPPNGAPIGPGSASNGIPVGPRGQQVAGAPSGPKGFRSAQLPSDYVNGVSFVGANGGPNSLSLNREDEDAEESDDELECRRKQKREEELEKQYLDQERRWLNRERTRTAAQERERAREAAERKEQERDKEAMRKRLADWNDDEEAEVGREEYYNDRSSWLRKRGAYRDREQREDARDRELGAREVAAERQRAAESRGAADGFLDRMGDELATRVEEAPGAVFGGFKISLGSAAARQQRPAATAPARAAQDVSGLLEDEEDAAASGLRRPELKPLTDTSTAPMRGQDLSEEERATARQQLAQEIPTSETELFGYELKWNYLSPQILQSQIRPFVEKKVVEYLGVQEDLLVDTVLEGIKEQKGAQDMVGLLEDVLEDEARVMVRKVWRLLVFWSESEARGLGL